MLWFWEEAHVLKVVVQIPALSTGHFSRIFVAKNCHNVCLKRQKNKRIRGGQLKKVFRPFN